MPPLSRSILPSKPSNTKYNTLWKRFQAYVEENNLPHNPVYLTRENVDSFFQNYISKLKVAPETCKAYRPALQWYADKIEHTDPAHPFEVSNKNERSIVETSLVHQARAYSDDYLAREHDAQASLPTDVLTRADHLKVIRNVLRKKAANWDNFGPCWNICQATFIRGDTMGSLRLCDMKADENHGPENGNNNDNWCISFILQPGQVKQNRVGCNPKRDKANARSHGLVRKPIGNFKKQVVGLYRHVEFEQCGAGMIAAAFFKRHAQHDPRMKFYKREGEQVPAWQHVPLITWETNKSMFKAYRSNMNDVQVSHLHVTHLRWSGIEQASRHGLQDNEISTMSGHIDSKIQRCYLTSLFPKLMKVMAGFRIGDPYFVPRTHIPYGPYGTLEAAVNAVFPDNKIWKEQMEGSDGDTHQSAKNFFTDLLPFLTMVIVQDAPLWLKHYPDHEHSRLLRTRLGQPFVKWAEMALRDMHRISVERTCMGVPDLSIAAQGAFVHLDNAIERNRQERVVHDEKVLSLLHDLGQHVNILNQQVSDLCTHITKQDRAIHWHKLQSAIQQQQEITNQRNLTRRDTLQPTAITPNTPDINTLEVDVDINEEEGEDNTDNRKPAAEIRPNTTIFRQLFATPPTPLEVANIPTPVNALDGLHNRPRYPEHGTNVLPDSMLDCIEKWREAELHIFEPGAAKRPWLPKEKVMYSKWKYAMDRIRQRANNGLFADAQQQNGVIDIEKAAAERYDEERVERGNLSMDRFIKHLKSTDPNAKTRKRNYATI